MHLLLKHMSTGLHMAKSSLERSSDYCMCNWSYYKEDVLVEKMLLRKSVLPVNAVNSMGPNNDSVPRNEAGPKDSGVPEEELQWILMGLEQSYSYSL